LYICTCLTEPEEAKSDDKPKKNDDGDIPVSEAMSDTNSAVTTTESKQPEDRRVRVPHHSPSPAISEHTPVPVSSPVPVTMLDTASAAGSTVDVTSPLPVSNDLISDQPTSGIISQGIACVG